MQAAVKHLFLKRKKKPLREQTFLRFGFKPHLTKRAARTPGEVFDPCEEDDGGLIFWWIDDRRVKSWEGWILVWIIGRLVGWLGCWLVVRKLRNTLKSSLKKWGLVSTSADVMTIANWYSTVWQSLRKAEKYDPRSVFSGFYGLFTPFRLYIPILDGFNLFQQIWQKLQILKFETN